MIINYGRIVFFFFIVMNSWLIGMEMANKLTCGESTASRNANLAENLVEKLDLIRQKLAESEARRKAEAERLEKERADAEGARSAKIRAMVNQQELVTQSAEDHETLEKLKRELESVKRRGNLTLASLGIALIWMLMKYGFEPRTVILMQEAPIRIDPETSLLIVSPQYHALMDGMQNFFRT